MDFVTNMAEEKIKQAIRDGEFENLPGKGKPLELEDMSSIPEDLRMSYHIMKNSGYLPEAVQVNKELVSLRDLIATCTSEEEKQAFKKTLTEKELRYRMLMEKQKRNDSSSFRKYSGKISKLFGI